MLTDEQLDSMTRNAPLLVNEYRKLRETLKWMCLAFEDSQKKEKELGLKLQRLRDAVNALSDPENRLVGVYPGPERDELEKVMQECSL